MLGCPKLRFKEEVDMKKTKKITITTFWLDWLLFPIVIVAAWLTF